MSKCNGRGPTMRVLQAKFWCRTRPGTTNEELYGGFIRNFTEFDQLDKAGRTPATVAPTAAAAAVEASIGPRAAKEAASQ